MEDAKYGQPYAYAYVVYQVLTHESDPGWTFWLDADGSGLRLFSDLEAACDEITWHFEDDTFCTPELVMLHGQGIELQTLHDISDEINGFLVKRGVSPERFECKKAAYIAAHTAGHTVDPRELMRRALPAVNAITDPSDLF